ncbi:hypothetical protein N7533_009644 [Penicillium manginii]|uniref:uncharacterized protein n=1 Tax=Penicillium manginii TaxID=203109 RepID=UPI002546B243|nr:uncharacterized protein N7533_009644 [Penicillium manginii]KAJ5744774.1 hypothetical protein N7533_009644 [Penicillium manginii]
MSSFTPVDLEFTKALPKVELHAHLSGSISRQCLHEIWQRKKTEDPTFAVEDPLVLMPPGKVDFTLQTFFSVFSKLIYQLCNDLESLKYATNSVLEDFLDDGVRYLELRTIPRPSPEANISREDYLNTILDTIDKFKARTQEIEAREIIDLAIANKPRGVVGVDICGNPTRGDVTLYQDAFARAKSHGLGLTLHFAETRASGTPAELATLLSFQPDRLGHVIHVPDEFKREIIRRRIGLELWFFCSPVSNEYLLAAQHFGLDRTDLFDIATKSVDAIFGGALEKTRLKEMLTRFALN